MTDEELRNLFLLLRKPIPWDPVPWWIKLGRDQIAKFNEVQTALNTKIAALEAQKVQELTKIAGMKK